MIKVNWYFSKCYLWGRSLLHTSKEDQLLVGYPKTGSTWIRYFLYSLLSQKVDDVELNIDAMNDAMPEFANSSFFNEWEFRECSRIVKTHQKCISPFRKNRSALIVRDPRDIVVSYYYYVSGLRASSFEGSVADVLRHPQMGAEAFFKHYATWRDHAGLVLRYEDLKDDPFVGFSKLAKFLGIERDGNEVQSAIEEANFSNMRVAQQKSDKLKAEFKEGHQFIRVGKKAQWRDLFSEADIQYYESLKAKYSFDLYD